MGDAPQGTGTALSEELVHDARDGHSINQDLAGYDVPVNLEVAQPDVVFLEERVTAANPLQSKGIGELGFCLAAGAIANAIHNAAGVRVRRYPAAHPAGTASASQRGRRAPLSDSRVRRRRGPPHHTRTLHAGHGTA